MMRLLTTALLAAGLFTPCAATARQTVDEDLFMLRKNFEIFGAMYERLILDYTDPIDAERLLRSGMAAMLSELDPYTVFYDEADNVAIDLVQRGRVGDIGVSLERRRDHIVVGPPSVSTSAYRQGLRPGDVVVRVGDQAAQPLSIADVRTLLRGSPGSFIELVVERPGVAGTLRFLLRREVPSAESVSFSGFLGQDTTAGIGYVRLERFGRDASRGVTRALRSLKDTNRLRGVILDLRGNPGGLLQDAISITQLFLPSETLIVSTRGRLAESAREYRSSDRPLFPEMPLVILVDGLSASAAEIVAGAIQDHDRGVILGEPTFGKGLVQIFRELPYNTSLKITTARYFTPSGRSIQSDRAGRPGTAVRSSALSATFQTASGRPVRAGNGIEPDVASPLGPPSEIERRLDREAAFARYVDRILSDAGEENAGELNWTEELTVGFRSFALATLSESPGPMMTMVSDLRDQMPAGPGSAVGRALSTLSEAAEAADAESLDQATARIGARLRIELAGRAGDVPAQVQERLKRDEDVAAAQQLLVDPGAYRAVLNPR